MTGEESVSRVAFGAVNVVVVLQAFHFIRLNERVGFQSGVVKLPVGLQECTECRRQRGLRLISTATTKQQPG